jgi:circadian clock protein KaiC
VTSQLKSLEHESTGSEALDRILGGGIPKRSIVVLAGEPGSGKTIVTLQMLFSAARAGKRCLYLTTLSEPAIKVMQYMQLFEFFDPQLLERNVVFADLGTAVRQGPDAALAEISRRVEKLHPDLVAIDSFRAIGELMGKSAETMRPFVFDLAVHLATWGATALLVGEYGDEEYSTISEFAVADGIIRLGSTRHELTTVRQVEVLKLRGSAYTTGQHFFEINQTGAEFYPRVSAPFELPTTPAPSLERITLGVPGLDELFGGGVLRASTTMVQGGSGTGKTLLGLKFLIEGCRRGEKGVLFTLEESPGQLRELASSLGWDLKAIEREGLLLLRYTSPVELSTDRFLHQVRGEVRALGARRAVLDSLSTLALGVPSERRFKEMVYAVNKHLRAAGVSTLMTVEVEQLLGAAQLSGQGVSFVADNLVQLRYVEMNGRLDRAISVLKARGTRHETELRAMVIDGGGIRVERDRFRQLKGVLTGLPSRDEGASP